MGSDSESDESREIVSSESQEADTTAGNSDEIRTGPSGVPHNVPPEVLSLLYSKETHEVKTKNTFLRRIIKSKSFALHDFPKG